MVKYFVETIFYILSLVLLLLFAFCIYTNNQDVLLYTAGALALAILFLHPKILFWAMICAIPLSIEYQLSDKLNIDFPDEIFMISTLGISVFIIMLSYQASLRYLWKNPFILLLLLQFVWCIVAAINSAVPLLSLKYLVAKLWYIIPFVIVPQLVFKDKKSLQTLAWCIIVPSLAGIIFTMYRHYHCDFSFSSVTECVKPLFRNHVTYAASVSVAFSVLIMLYFYFKTKIPRLLLFMILILFVAAICFSYTRGTWVSIVCSLLVTFFLYKKLIKQLLIVSLIMVCIGIGYLVSDNNYLILKPKYEETVFHKDFAEHLHATYAMKEISASERIYRWIAGFKMTTVHPVIGFGPSAFYSSYMQYTDKRFETYVSNNPEKSTVHNYFLLTLVEQGYIGLVILLLLVFLFYARCEFLFFRIEDRFYKGVILILCLVMTNILVVNLFSDMIETDKVGTVYFLCFGVLIWLDTQWSANEQAIT